MESILTSIKKLLGIAEEYEHFDIDIIIHINTAFSVLTQLGVGPSSGYSINDKHAVWNEFIPAEDKRFNSVKTYVYLKTRLVFDPPQNTALFEAMERTAKELEWRLNVSAEEGS